MSGKFSCGTKWVVPSRHDDTISPAQEPVAAQDLVHDLACFRRLPFLSHNLDSNATKKIKTRDGVGVVSYNNQLYLPKK